MADEQEHHASSRFRLPRFFGQPSEAVAEVGADVEVSVDEAELPSTREEIAPTSSPMVVGPFVAGSVVAALTAGKNRVSGAKNPPVARAGESQEDLMALRHAIEELGEQIAQVNHRETSLERVFDALHAELADYKKDFLYEHLKPVVRPLLFLFDSLEQFDGEIAAVEAHLPPLRDGSHLELSPTVVRENVQFFRDQLAEALQVCEVTRMETPSGAFNARVHRAVEVAPVPLEADGTIVRVVRSGWYLNGQLLRPAEVVVGKHRG